MSTRHMERVLYRLMTAVVGPVALAVYVGTDVAHAAPAAVALLAAWWWFRVEAAGIDAAADVEEDMATTRRGKLLVLRLMQLVCTLGAAWCRLAPWLVALGWVS